jgi:hypothetical protein
MNIIVYDTPSGLDCNHHKIYHHWTPSGSSGI